MARIAGAATILTTTAVIDFPSTSSTTADSSGILVPGAEPGDIVVVGVPAAAAVTGASFSGFVSALNTVKVRLSASGAGVDPGSGTFYIAVIKAEK